MRGYRTKVRRIQASPLGKMDLAKLKSRHIDSWYADLAAKGMGAANIETHHRVLSAALRQAQRWE